MSVGVCEGGGLCRCSALCQCQWVHTYICMNGNECKHVWIYASIDLLHLQISYSSCVLHCLSANHYTISTDKVKRYDCIPFSPTHVSKYHNVSRYPGIDLNFFCTRPPG